MQRTCSSCGQPLSGNPATAEAFCPACGARTAPAEFGQWQSGFPLVVLGVVAAVALMVCLLAQRESPVPLMRQAREMVFGKRLSSAADQAIVLARSFSPPSPDQRNQPPLQEEQGDSPANEAPPMQDTPQPTAPEAVAQPPTNAPPIEAPPAEVRPVTPVAPAQRIVTPPPTVRPQAPTPTRRQQQAPTGRVRSSGSSFFITDDGYLLTSRHVVANANRVVIRTKQGDFPAQVVMTSSNYDVALLKAVGSFKALPLANSQSVKLGDGVFTIGFPSPSIQGVEPKFTRGEINSLAGIQDDRRFFQMSVAIQPGNSGGPLVTMAGNTVGIIAMRLNDMSVLEAVGSLPQNVNYAVKSSFILEFLRTVPAVTGKLKPLQAAAFRRSEDVVKDVEEAVGLVLVY